MPRDETAPFKTQYEIGASVLRRQLEAWRIPVDELSAGLILRGAWDEWQRSARLLEGVTKEWLWDIQKLSAGVGAVTDGDEEDVRRLLERTGLARFFNSVTTSEAVQAYKPSPRVYRAAMDSLRAPPERSLFVSDSVVDLVGASAVGMAVAWFHRDSSEASSALPAGTLRVNRPAILTRALMRFAETGRFELS